MIGDGRQPCECAYCGLTGFVGISAKRPEGGAKGFVCLGGPLMPSLKLRALCDGCVRAAVSAFGRSARIEDARGRA